MIYKHFDDLDHLILFASVKFLENYIIDLQTIVNEQSDSLEMLLSMWRVFAKYAFQTIDVFELLFWGKYNARLGDTIFEYYQIFPDEMKKLDGLFTSVFFNNEIKNSGSNKKKPAARKSFLMAGFFSNMSVKKFQKSPLTSAARKCPCTAFFRSLS